MLYVEIRWGVTLDIGQRVIINFGQILEEREMALMQLA
jgi:hypothetical protein